MRKWLCAHQLRTYSLLIYRDLQSINTKQLEAAGHRLTLAILVEILSHTVGIEAEREAQALQDIIAEEAEILVDSLAQETALKLLQMFSTAFEPSDFRRRGPRSTDVEASTERSLPSSR